VSTSWTWKIVSHSLLWLLFLAAIVVAAKEKQPGKKLRGVMIFALQNGEIVELQKEHGFGVLTTQIRDAQPDSIQRSSVVQNDGTHGRLPGDKSKVRFPQGSGFNLLAEFAAGTEPGSLQLMRFGTQGRQLTARWMSGKLLAARASMRSAMPRCGCGKLAMYANTGSAPFAAFAALALPVMATSSFAGVLPWAVFLPWRPTARFVD
jgi:hypothetical protein